MHSRLTLPLALLAPVMLVIGLLLGVNADNLPGPVRDALGSSDDQAAIEQAIDLVNERYYREISKDELANKAIGGMVKGLDDQFSTYFDPRQFKDFLENQDARFSGVGLAVSEHPRGLRVRDVYDDSPAKRARIRSGDLVVEVDGKSLKGLDQEKSVRLIRGVPGSDVTLVTERDGKRRTVKMTRATISLPVVASRTVEKNGKKYAVIALAQFTNGAHGEVAAAVKKAEAQDVDGIIFDLRGNPGGLVTEAQLVASVFLENGKIVTTKGRNSPERTLYASGDAVAPNTPMVVLVDRNSASAAEIVAGALQDDDRARLIGTRTYGKGVFQEVLELDNGGALDITAGQYFTPSGRNLGGTGTKTGNGLKPDVRAPDNPKTDSDETLNRAYEVIR